MMVRRCRHRLSPSSAVTPSDRNSSSSSSNNNRKALAACCYSLLASGATTATTTTTAATAPIRRYAAFVPLHPPSSSLSSLSSSSFGLRTSASAVAVASSSLKMSTAAEASSSSEVNVASNLNYVLEGISSAAASCGRDEGAVKLVAVSKTKPIELLREAYDAGQRRFGENYAQELMSKSSELPDDILWHFIGPLQSNKAAPLVKKVGLDKLACVETVGSVKLATKLNRAVETLLEEERGEGEGEGEGEGDGSEGKKNKLGIYVQVNTSGEDTKSGVSPGEELLSLLTAVTESCPHLSVDGLMTIGAPGDYGCFDALVQCRRDAAEALGVEESDLELSMGMSGDFEEAIKRGATSVRVGSTIFGARDYSNLTKDKK